MKNFAFIFARGGSKGLPGKNIKPLVGKPLIEYSIDIAMASNAIEKVFVSTEDPQIAEIAGRLGAIIINRPKELATDFSSEWLAWRHAVNWVLDNYGYFDNFVSLPATSPLRSVDDVEAALIKREEVNADICISVTKASRSPYFNMVVTSNDGQVNLVNPPSESLTRRQDAPPVYDITTVVYTASPEFILNKNGLFEGKVTSIEVPKERAVDIDDIFDFKFAEILLKES